MLFKIKYFIKNFRFNLRMKRIDRNIKSIDKQIKNSLININEILERQSKREQQY
jgi:hypothetical protein